MFLGFMLLINKFLLYVFKLKTSLILLVLRVILNFFQEFDFLFLGTAILKQYILLNLKLIFIFL